METLSIPKHVAIIMDGNSRWAKSKSLPVHAGHKKGSEAAKKVVESCKKLGVEYLTLYAFSSENWNRPKKEVDYLMDLLRDYLKSAKKNMLKENVRMRFIGRREELAKDIQDMMNNLEEESKDNTFNLILAISYGARNEIKDAAVKFAKFASEHNNFDGEIFERFLDTKEIPDPDLFIRTSGEMRISNFLLWQLAYAELYFSNKYWPDFDESELQNAITEYTKRERRYGGR